MEWESVDYVWVMALCAVGAAAVWVLAHRSALYLPQWVPLVQGHRPWLRGVLRAAVLLLLGVAAMGPAATAWQEPQPALGRQIYFLLDVSASMNASDVSPTRLRGAKEVIRRVATSLPSDEVGLIAFTSFAYTQCPLTTDHPLFLTFLDIAETRYFANSGTDLRAALDLAALRFSAERPQGQTPPARVIVLLTDGEHFGSGFTSKLIELKGLGIKVIPVGIGTTRGTSVPPFLPGEEPGAKAAPRRGRTRLNEKVLKELAAEFGTTYTPLAGPIATARQLVSTISTLPPAALKSGGTAQMMHLYPFLVLPALALLALSWWLLPYRKA